MKYMTQNNGKQKNIDSKTLLVVSKEANEKLMRDTIIRVVDWIVEGKHYPQLEKREFFATEGGMKMGKAKGFTRKDLIVVQDKWGEIMAALGSKLPEDSKKPGVTQPTTSAPVDQKEEDF